MIQEVIESKLRDNFQPEFLEVSNESYMHNVPLESESHFKVVIVTNHFDGQRLLMRHRQVNQVLADELRNHIHALAIHTYTPKEWDDLQKQAPDSPMCLGG